MAEVLQCDRDAAARLMPVNTIAECERVADTRSGRNDSDHRVQAFAAHREAAEKAVIDWLRSSAPFYPKGNIAADAIERGDHRKG